MRSRKRTIFAVGPQSVRFANGASSHRAYLAFHQQPQDSLRAGVVATVRVCFRAQKFGEIATKQFLEITHTPKSAIQSKRSIPPDVERLHRIVQNSDSLLDINLSPAERALRSRAIMSDIEGLSASSRQEEGTQNLLKHLPWQKVPGLPDTVVDVIL
jgi:hypothetical protein